MSDLDLFPHELRPARGEPAGGLVLLHGRGADELDLLPLLDALDPDGRLAGITARAPLQLPPGGWHWYVVPRVGFPDPATFQDTFARLTRWLDAVPEALGVPLERIVLGGFSQGAVMAYALTLGSGRPTPAGLIALSAFIPTVDGFEVALDDRAGLRVAIGHGTYDPVISVDFARDARRRLEDAGVPVTYTESPMPHAIDPGFVRELHGWLAETLGQRGEAGEAGPPG